MVNGLLYSKIPLTYRKRPIATLGSFPVVLFRMKLGEMICDAPPFTPERAPAVASAARFAPPKADDSRFVSVLTLVVWLGCSVVAALGFAMPYVRPQAPAPQPEPTQVEMLNVELTSDPLPDSQPPSGLTTLSDVIPQPQTPQAVAVAMPSPSIAFALPVEGPVRVVEAAQASYSRSDKPAPAVTAPLQPQALTFGQGLGKQPAPEYPIHAQNAGQEGPVGVRIQVGADGRVVSVEASEPSRWAALNDAVLRTVRRSWRFPAGQSRIYTMTFRFQLQN
jgi:TonB family protein